MTIEQFTKETFKEENGFCFRPRIYCKDGFNMSVQGNKGSYCTPRKTLDLYLSMEIGFPSEKENLIIDFAEIKEQPTESVYGYVPCEIIQEVINKHGGIDLIKTFEK